MHLLCQVCVNKTRTRLLLSYVGHFWFTSRLAFVGCAASLPNLATIWFVIFGPYSPFTKQATLGSYPDYTLQSALHLCQKRLTFDLQYLGHICYLTCGPLHIHFAQAIRRPTVPHYCLKWPIFIYHTFMLSGPPLSVSIFFFYFPVRACCSLLCDRNSILDIVMLI